MEQLYDAVREVLADLPVQRCAGAVAARLASLSSGQPDVPAVRAGASMLPSCVGSTDGLGGDTSAASATGASADAGV